MTRETPRPIDLALFGQLSWFIRLRWGAGLAVIAGAFIDRYWLHWPGACMEALAVGAGILLYNAVLRVLVRPRPSTEWKYRTLVTIASVQIVLDLSCLTLMAVWTDGAHSPMLGFFVFHMVISSLLLPYMMAYAGAVFSCLMLLVGLWLTGQFPVLRGDIMIVAGWMIMLLITVYLTSNITRSLNRHRRRVLRQKHRIRSMSDELRRQNRAMIQQEKMAAMGQLAAGVAHEIANPLASMDSLLQLLHRKPERARDGAIEKLRDQITRINRIVRQLTDFAHPGDEQWQNASIDKIVAQSLQMIRFDHRMRSVKMDFRRELAPEDSWVRVQAHAMEQVFVNIVLNALDAMADEDDPRLNIHVGQDGKQCFVAITDNGHGIAPEHLDHIFEPFFTTKPVGKGTGLGLAVSYRLVRSHGGQLEAENVDNGTRFTVYLPKDGVSQK
jgi:signal transduction histidine kinase